MNICSHGPPHGAPPNWRGNGRMQPYAYRREVFYPRVNFSRHGEDVTRMTDALGWRAKFGVLAPSTNTIVEPDFYRMSVPGVTAHFARIHIRDQNLGSDAAFEALLEQVREEMDHAVAQVLTAEPDYMIMGMSSETFWGGVEGHRQFIKQIKECSHGL